MRDVQQGNQSSHNALPISPPPIHFSTKHVFRNSCIGFSSAHDFLASYIWIFCHVELFFRPAQLLVILPRLSVSFQNANQPASGSRYPCLFLKKNLHSATLLYFLIKPLSRRSSPAVTFFICFSSSISGVILVDIICEALRHFAATAFFCFSFLLHFLFPSLLPLPYLYSSLFFLVLYPILLPTRASQCDREPYMIALLCFL